MSESSSCAPPDTFQMQAQRGPRPYGLALHFNLLASVKYIERTCMFTWPALFYRGLTLNPADESTTVFDKDN
eukprot:scaffold149384_cov19-Tisochrysis_lutea.AAC.2